MPAVPLVVPVQSCSVREEDNIGGMLPWRRLWRPSGNFESMGLSKHKLRALVVVVELARLAAATMISL